MFGAVDLGGGESGRMSAPITNGLMEQYGVTTEELHDIALQNLSESQIEFKTMRDVLVDMMFPDGIKEGDPRAFMLPPERNASSRGQRLRRMPRKLSRQTSPERLREVKRSLSASVYP